MLTALYVAAGAMMLGLAAVPPLALGTTLMFFGMGLLGMGNGSVFQLVPQRFPNDIGVLTGVVGAAGGVGGFFLPNLLGGLQKATGSFAGGFGAFGLAALGCAVALVCVGRSWAGTFVRQGGLAAGAAPAAPRLPPILEGEAPA
jgi:NNP family nitrate/nitrite transporter-like MFS transporter